MTATARAYGAILSARFRSLLQYRAAALAGLATQIFWGWIRLMIFEAFYRSSSATQPMSLQDTITYVWLTQALLILLPFRYDTDVRDLIRSGHVAYELARPLDLFSIWYVRAVALRSAPALLRALPMVALAIPFFGMGLPASWAALGAFLLSIVGALLVSAAITTLMSISMMWTIAGDGIVRLLSALTNVLSGAIIPLPLFPNWAQSVLNVLPFRAVMDIPFRLYTGNLPVSDFLPLFLFQLGWAAALILLGRWLLSRGLKRLVLQGG